MGKAGKARKKQRIERTLNILSSADVVQGSEDESDSEGKSDISSNILIAISVFDALSVKLDRYTSKQFKSLRTAIFPLIEEQSNKFFEDVNIQITDSQASQVLCPRNINIAALTAAHFASNIDDFRSPELKQFRRALHPLVLLHTKGNAAGHGAGPPLAACGGGHDMKSTRKRKMHISQAAAKKETNLAIEHEQPLSAHYWETDSTGTLSNRISSCFRQGLWEEALRALHDMAEDPFMTPKLGAVQRWVRECDTESFSNAAAIATTAALAVALGSASGPDRSCDTTCDRTTGSGNNSCADGNKKGNEGIDDDTIWRPSYAMGKMGLVGLSHDSDRYKKRVMSLRLLHAVMRVMQVKNTHLVPVAQLDPEEGYIVECVCHAPFECDQWEKGNAPTIHTTDDAAAYLLSQAGIQQEALVSGTSTTLTKENWPNGEDSEAITTESSCHSVGSLVYPVLLPAILFMGGYVRVVSHVAGHLRRPPSSHDLRIYMTSPTALRFEEYDGAPAVTAFRHDVPGVAGSFILSNVLTPSECAQFILAAEHIKFVPDAVDGIDNVQWLADEVILDVIHRRCLHLLPSHMDGCALSGINAKFRLFRYFPGAVYRPHIDGAWPGSGLTADGAYTDDAFDNKRHSRLTFLVYLNDGFEGGETTFFMPGGEDANCGGNGATRYVNAHAVVPKLGSVLCFPHGSAMGSLVHEGSAVRAGVKYIIRSDVLYSTH